MNRTWPILALLALAALAACARATSAPSGGGAGEPSATAPSPTARPGAGPQSCDDPFQGVQLRFEPSLWPETDFCRHSVPYEEILSGGPPPDGIPPIDQPRFESAAEADEWLEDVEPVILLQVKDQVRAYPLQILIWHEIVNDEVAGLPVVVTFCPLCYTALVFERPEVGGERLTFGTTGNLRYSDLVMWDRQTHSWWQQFSGEAIVGELTGTRLRRVPADIVAWADARALAPDLQVLSRQTGFRRPYGQNPYVGYDDVSQTPFLYDGPVEEGYPPMARFVGVQLPGGAKGYPNDLLRERRVVNDVVGGVEVVLFWKPGTASAVDAVQIAAGDDVGSTRVYARRIDDQVLTFAPTEEEGIYVDAETGSRWTFWGEAVDGPLAGSRLEEVPHIDTFWFVWGAFEGAEVYAP